MMQLFTNHCSCYLNTLSINVITVLGQEMHFRIKCTLQLRHISYIQQLHYISYTHIKWLEKMCGPMPNGTLNWGLHCITKVEHWNGIMCFSCTANHNPEVTGDDAEFGGDWGWCWVWWRLGIREWHGDRNCLHPHPHDFIPTPSPWHLSHDFIPMTFIPWVLSPSPWDMSTSHSQSHSHTEHVKNVYIKGCLFNILKTYHNM